ncbi:hypothetical protein D9756_010486 [Leucocoprinus leucothites]|uniref:HAT C-terminal dimerisation domain-containing protein n=1 Tax=Leucocoprinus leucothites TaxID=201217 RepID=A0A8H5FTP8_9AGAR|nr:hypothetical protein D9756_010486 [Leucoagaricus leucothites]
MDDEIIEASFAHLKSLAYQHFNITLDCVLKDDEPSELVFILTCKTDPDRHTAHHQGCMKTHTGTGNLQKGIKACNWLNGLAEDGSSLSRMGFIVLKLLCSEREQSFQVLKQSITSGIHLVLEGWTAPIVVSYLGLVVIWSEQGTIYRTVLEFIRLKHKHTGEYLAKVVFDCLKCWGLTKKMFMSFFFKKGKKKSNQAIVSDDGLVSVDDHSTFVADQVVEVKDDEDDGVLEEDDGHAIFNQKTVLALHQPAIMQMQAREEPITAIPAQLCTAEGIMPWVSNLTHHIHDSPTLRTIMDDYWIWELSFSQALLRGLIYPSHVESILLMDDDDELLPVIHIAAQAAISMVNKYVTLCEECEIYIIAIVMCPDRKLQWFKDNGFSHAVISQLKQTRVTNKYMKKPTATKSTAGKLDDIHTYLKEPVIQSSTVIDLGGYMKWWKTTATSCPNLARMGMNYCSAPGSYISHTQSFLI